MWHLWFTVHARGCSVDTGYAWWTVLSWTPVPLLEPMNGITRDMTCINMLMGYVCLWCSSYGDADVSRLSQSRNFPRCHQSIFCLMCVLVKVNFERCSPRFPTFITVSTLVEIGSVNNGYVRHIAGRDGILYIIWCGAPHAPRHRILTCGCQRNGQRRALFSLTYSLKLGKVRVYGKLGRWHTGRLLLYPIHSD